MDKLTETAMKVFEVAPAVYSAGISPIKHATQTKDLACAKTQDWRIVGVLRTYAAKYEDIRHCVLAFVNIRQKGREEFATRMQPITTEVNLLVAEGVSPLDCVAYEEKAAAEQIAKTNGARLQAPILAFCIPRKEFLGASGNVFKWMRYMGFYEQDVQQMGVYRNQDMGNNVDDIVVYLPLIHTLPNRIVMSTEFQGWVEYLTAAWTVSVFPYRPQRPEEYHVAVHHHMVVMGVVGGTACDDMYGLYGVGVEGFDEAREECLRDDLLY
jgi:hypothetical protein